MEPRSRAEVQRAHKAKTLESGNAANHYAHVPYVDELNLLHNFQPG